MSQSQPGDDVHQQKWSQVDQFLEQTLLTPDPVLQQILENNRRNELPEIDVSPSQGSFLQMLIRTIQAKRVLEIGTLGGYSTVWMARGLPPDGTLVTLELESLHANVATENFATADLSDKIEVRLGDALTSLNALTNGDTEPFDFIFIDANKETSLEYFEASLQLAKAGALIVVDNIVRDGEIINPNSDDERVIGVQKLLKHLTIDQRVETTAFQSVGSKGYDGMLISRVIRSSS